MNPTTPARSRLVGFTVAVISLVIIAVVAILFVSTISTKQTTRQPATIVQQSTANVTITDKGFVPATIVVQKGTRITWTNTDKVSHQIQANPYPTGKSLPSLKSHILNNQQVYEYTANTTGTFNYHDYLNPTTNGTIQVKD